MALAFYSGLRTSRPAPALARADLTESSDRCVSSTWFQQHSVTAIWPPSPTELMRQAENPKRHLASTGIGALTDTS